MEKSILATICYFDIFDYPLTLVEIWKWLPEAQRVKLKSQSLGKITIKDIQKTLADSPNLKSVVSTHGGFYFLPGREKIIRTRLDRYNIADQKFKKAIRIIKLLHLIPFVRMIAVCNTLGYSNAKEESDIDLFIITSPGRIWLVRFFSISLLTFLGLRPKPNQSKNKFCLSFLVTDDNLNLEQAMLDKDDIHFVYWLSQFVPVYNEDNTWEKFVRANQWAKNYFPNSFDYQTNLQRRVKSFLGFIKKFIEFTHSFAFDGLSEKFYKWLQLKIMPQNLKEMANKDTRVIIKDNMLKFHYLDRRKYYNDLFYSRIHEILGKNN